jgi:hypothetical protein
MKNSSLRIAIAIAAILTFTLVAQAQNRERFGISAKAGGVNAVSGQVTVKREGQPAQLLTSQDDLVSGDVVTTGFGGQAEVLLNPGTYLRLAENSEFVLVDSTLDNLLVRLNRGSAIIEATGPDNVLQKIPVETKQQKFTLVRAGIYRINATPVTTEIFIRKGRIVLGNDPKAIIKSGKKVVIDSGTPIIANLNKNDKDDFDDWSKARGETLARANQRLNPRTLGGFLSSSAWGWPDARFGRWGLWTWSSFSNCYTFLPFFYGWGSPYGSNYGFYAGFGGFYPDGTCCRTHIYNRPVIVTNPTYGGGSGSGSGSGGTNGGSSGGSGGASSGGSGGVINTTPSSPRPEPRSMDSGPSVHKIKDPD